MVKLFIGNLPREATEQEIRALFEQYGKVLECDIVKNYGFVHIEDRTAAEDAIRNLHHHKLHGVCINVEASKNKSKASTKLHVGNISPACTNLELRAKFEEYGPVIECDIVKDYAFVHMERAEDAVEAIRGLDNAEFQGGTGVGWGWAPWMDPGSAASASLRARATELGAWGRCRRCHGLRLARPRVCGGLEAALSAPIPPAVLREPPVGHQVSPGISA
ncbi:RNA-binding protein 4B isoform X3 [Aix galericulata]|nr:RNA-binding protein 4B isoform X3 [Aix galericulata]